MKMSIKSNINTFLGRQTLRDLSPINLHFKKKLKVLQAEGKYQMEANTYVKECGAPKG